MHSRQIIVDGQVVLNLSDTGRRPCGPFGDIPLVPGPDLAAKDDPAAFGLDGDPRCLELSTPLQRLLDLLLDLEGMDRCRDPDLVDDVDHAGELVHYMVSIGLLKLPIDLARQGHYPLFDLDRDAIGRKPDLPLQDIDRARSNLVIRTLRVRR